MKDKKVFIIGALLVLFLVTRPKTASATTSNTIGGKENGFDRTFGTHGSIDESYLGLTPVHGNRGIRNNNPTNIKYSSSNSWLGKIPYNQNTDTNSSTGAIEKKFEQFSSYPYGVRAAIYLAKNSYIAQGHDTPLSFINRWANTPDASYPNYIARQLGIGLNDKIPTDYASLKKLIQSIARFENGRVGTAYPEVITDIQFDTAYNRVNQL